MTRELTVEVVGETGMRALAGRLAAALPPRALLVLTGPLGAGKTRLVQGLAAWCGVPRDEVISPTFVLQRRYEGRQAIDHLDAYRLRDDDEWHELGVDELWEQSTWVVIEWGERFGHLLPVERLAVEIAVTGETTRQVTLRGEGAAYERVVEAMRQ